MYIKWNGITISPLPFASAFARQFPTFPVGTGADPRAPEARPDGSIAIYFQDRTAFYLKITPLFTLKPEYYRLKPHDMETIKKWPEIKMER